MTITQTEYDDNRHGRYKTKIVIMSIDEADSVGTRGYASITKSYNEWDWEDDAMTETDSGITRSYRGYNEKL